MGRKKSNETETVTNANETQQPAHEGPRAGYINPAVQAEVANTMPAAPASVVAPAPAQTMSDWLDGQWERSLRRTAQGVLDEIFRDQSLSVASLFEALSSEKLRPHLKHLRIPNISDDGANGDVASVSAPAPKRRGRPAGKTGAKRGRPAKADKQEGAKKRGRPRKVQSEAGASASFREGSPTAIVLDIITKAADKGILKQAIQEKLVSIDKKYAEKTFTANNAIASLTKKKLIKAGKQGNQAIYHIK